MTTKRKIKIPRPGVARTDPTLASKRSAAEELRAAKAGEASSAHATGSGGPVKTDGAPDRSRARREPGSVGAKASFDASVRRRPERQGDEPRPDQKPPAQVPPGAGTAAGAGDPDPEASGYVRIRIRARDGQLRVVDSSLVEGPLAQPTGFPMPNAYEVSLDGRLLHADAVPELGVSRSFPNPGGPPVQQGHHFGVQDIVEFVVRVPAREITPDTVGRIQVQLHRVKDEVPAAGSPEGAVSDRFRRAVRPIAELVGLPASVLPQQIRERGAVTPSM
jgi:hypothetical protein